MKKVFLEISQNSQENTCASLFFHKVAGLGTAVAASVSKGKKFYRTQVVIFLYETLLCLHLDIAN